MNPYLKAKREEYEALRSTIEGFQTRAAEANRSLTEDEMKSVNDQAAAAKKIADEIESLTEIETRNAKVAQLSVTINGSGSDADKDTETRAAGFTTKDRDPGHYRSVKDGGQHSFFGDLYRSSRLRDTAASQRLAEHQRALEPTAEGTGIIPPKWMADEFAELARQGRKVADVVRKLPISDSRPIPMGKQTAGTDAVVAEMANEQGTTSWTDAYDTDVDTLTPKVTSGGQKFRRELLDSSTPAIDQLVYGDLLAVYNEMVEAKVVAAIFAAGSAALEYDGTATSTTDADHLFNRALFAALAVRQNRKLPATGFVMGVGTYGKLLGTNDSTGRPIMPAPQPGQSVNVFGVGSVAVDGIMHAVPVFATEVAEANDDDLAAVRLSDVILAESSTLRFYDEYTEGPEVIRLAVWGYTGAIVRYATQSVQKLGPADES